MQSVSKKVLVVEDEKEILDLIQMYLEREGYRTVTAMTGFEALKLIRVEHPNLVILDLMLPEMDGFECVAILDQIRQVPERPSSW